MMNTLKKLPKGMLAFFALMVFVAIGNAFSDSIYSNYFRDAYHMDAFWRGITEWPRESPGMLCVFVVVALAGLGDLRISLIAQILACVGLTVLGLTTPPLAVMYVFLFINSLGMHLFVPLQDSIGMSLAEKDNVGKRMGQYASLRSVVGFVCAIIVWLGARANWIDFTARIKPVFLVGALGFLGAVVMALVLIRNLKGDQIAESRKPKLLIRREYKYFYLLSILHGVQKQITFVFGSWVLIDLLGLDVGTMMLIYIGVNLLCVFFMRLLGNWMDRYGIKRMMYVNALAFLGVYIVYGLCVFGIGRWYANSVAIVLVATMFVLDRLSMQSGIVKSVYLCSIALNGNDVTSTLSTGITLDHIVSLIAAPTCGLIWRSYGPHWVFFIAAAFSFGNLYVAWRIAPEKARKDAAAAPAGSA